MRRLLALLLALLLGGCAGAASALPVSAPAALGDSGDGTEGAAADRDGMSAAGTEKPEKTPEETTDDAFDDVYIPSENLTAEETVAAYFDLQYKMYVENRPIDLSAILNMEKQSVRNSVVWTEMLLQRRRLLLEYELCYVETEAFAYEINFFGEDELEDDRLAFWKDEERDSDEVRVLHFTITGEAGRAYPPIMAVNSQQTMRLRRVDGVWKITFHYFPGSIRKFYRNGTLKMQDEDEVLEALLMEFVDAPHLPPEQIDENLRRYDSEQAVAYAEKYTESRNPRFYGIMDWMGNCANFTSQCIWYGFSGEEDWSAVKGKNWMTPTWYASRGGGSPAWENVDHFWTFATESGEAAYTELPCVMSMETGDILQTRSLFVNEDDEGFNHNLILVDKDTMRMAQNTPDCFVYYSDIFNVETRFLRPIAM